MQSDPNPDDSLTAMIDEVFAFGRKQVSAATKPEGLSVPVNPTPPPSDHINSDIELDLPPPLGPNRAHKRKESKTAAELAIMIETDLAQHPECPRSGFRITVYGATHWRAMLTITPAAGGLRDPHRWRDMTDELAERLRQRYDLAW
jgi:hypothetical protein